MASSGDYYDYYKQEKKKVKSYEDDISVLEKIEGNLANDMYDEINNINKEIDNLKADLQKSVRYNDIFTKCKNELEEENSVASDSDLSVAVTELQEEISRVKGLKSTAESNRDYYYRMYEQKKAEEREARKNALKDFFGLN